MSYTKTNQSKLARPLSYRKKNQMPTAIRQMNQYSNSNIINGFNWSFYEYFDADEYNALNFLLNLIRMWFVFQRTPIGCQSSI